MRGAPTCAALAATLIACSPALNWRQVQLEQITVLLPCKPDRAQRTVQLGPNEVKISMAGCEADAVLFAVSHLHRPDAAKTTELVAAWRDATLANIRATGQTPRPISPPPGTSEAMHMTAQGQRPDGREVQAHLRWIVAGDNIYHIAAYGDRLTAEQTDSLFSDLRIQ